MNLCSGTKKIPPSFKKNIEWDSLGNHLGPLKSGRTTGQEPSKTPAKTKIKLEKKQVRNPPQRGESARLQETTVERSRLNQSGYWQ